MPTKQAEKVVGTSGEDVPGIESKHQSYEHFVLSLQICRCERFEWVLPICQSTWELQVRTHSCVIMASLCFAMARSYVSRVIGVASNGGVWGGVCCLIGEMLFS